MLKRTPGHRHTLTHRQTRTYTHAHMCVRAQMHTYVLGHTHDTHRHRTPDKPNHINDDFFISTTTTTILQLRPQQQQHITQQKQYFRFRACFILSSYFPWKYSIGIRFQIWPVTLVNKTNMDWLTDWLTHSLGHPPLNVPPPTPLLSPSLSLSSIESKNRWARAHHNHSTPLLQVVFVLWWHFIFNLDFFLSRFSVQYFVRRPGR